MRRAFALAVALSAAETAPALESDDCLILPSASIDLGGTVPGQIASVAVDVGDSVRKGQIIASMRTDVQEAIVEVARLRSMNVYAVDAAEAQLAYEAAELERIESLHERGIATDADLLQRQTGYRLRESELEEARIELRLAHSDWERAKAELEVRLIRSPIDGLIAARYLDGGEYLRDDGEVVTIVQIDPLKVEVFLPQEFFRQVVEGDVFFVQGAGSETAGAEAWVTTIDPVIDPASATFSLRAELPNPDGQLVSGVRCLATFSMME